MILSINLVWNAKWKHHIVVEKLLLNIMDGVERGPRDNDLWHHSEQYNFRWRKKKIEIFKNRLANVCIPAIPTSIFFFGYHCNFNDFLLLLFSRFLYVYDNVNKFFFLILIRCLKCVIIMGFACHYSKARKVLFYSFSFSLISFFILQTHNDFFMYKFTCYYLPYFTNTCSKWDFWICERIITMKIEILFCEEREPHFI